MSIKGRRWNVQSEVSGKQLKVAFIAHHGNQHFHHLFIILSFHYFHLFVTPLTKIEKKFSGHLFFDKAIQSMDS